MNNVHMILSLYEKCIICLINKELIFRKKDFITEFFLYIIKCITFYYMEIPIFYQ